MKVFRCSENGRSICQIIFCLLPLRIPTKTIIIRITRQKKVKQGALPTVV